MILSLAHAALACPTIATGTSSPLAFDVARVAIVREGETTTFAVSVNPAGDPQNFALVMPVPEVLGPEDVRTLDSELFATLDGYSAPRHVSDAGCPRDSSYDSDNDSDNDSGGGGGGVDVEANFLVGEYEITILSADESAALGDWLDGNGYFLPEGADERLAGYIEGGSFFLTAKVADDAALADGTALSPLQITYQNAVFYIPIRLATLNSPGEQDMVIYAITDRGDARVGISNYPEFAVADRCIWGDPAADDFGDFYEGMFADAWTAAGDAGWTVEYAGGPGECNPCTSVTLDEASVADLGFTGAFEDHFLTRLRMRYTVDQADEDLMLYGSGIEDPEVTSYADDFSMNYECVETFCDGTDTPGNEGDADTDTDTDTDTDADADTDTDTDTDFDVEDSDGTGDAECGCAAGAGAGWVAALVAAAAARRRAGQTSTTRKARSTTTSIGAPFHSRR